MKKEEIMFLSGSGNYRFGFKVLQKLNELSGQNVFSFDHINYNEFPEGELDNRIPSYGKIKNKTIVLFQSMHTQELVTETLDLLWAIKHQYQAKNIICIFPFMWNRRQDPKMEIDKNELERIPKPDEFQRLRMIISMLQHCGMDDLIVATPHSKTMFETCKEFNVIMHEIDPSELFVERIRTFVPESELGLIRSYAPDRGSIIRAVKIAKMLNCPIFFNLKNRMIYNETSIVTTEGINLKEKEEELRVKYSFPEIHYVTSELVKDKIMLIVEDEIASGGTANSTAKLLRKNGAKDIFLLATHPVLTMGWKNKLFNENPFTRIIATDSIPRHYKKRTGGLIVDVSITQQVASSLFQILNRL
ncbi:MAG: phosphoribosyltransferase family protein [Candidatus Woesebacteria bacterium]|nr:phosphoribosyltransferase family protein [Candidatus Woesebacteria bacterium]